MADLHTKRKDWSPYKVAADLCVKQKELVQYHRELTIYIVNTFLTQTNAVSLAASPRICTQSARIRVRHGGVAADLQAKRKDWSPYKVAADLCVKQKELVQYHREPTIYIANTFLTQTIAMSVAASPRICTQSGGLEYV
ncbi:unnamed protein product [Vicia faba]|uniref:Uncharacterized protein n=1 Tax=Vicia faba TaxID=3906 RepID=A0AAV0YWC7_VICFA|nr:unnamed protein product [Vicia faba]